MSSDSGPVEQIVLTEGRYLGDDGRWLIDLRIETGPSETFSADLRGAGTRGPIELSVRTRPANAEGGPPHDSPLTRAAVWTDGSGAVAGGSVTIRPAGVRAIGDNALDRTGNLVEVHGTGLADQVDLDVTFTIDQALGDLPPGFAVTLTATRVSPTLRDIGVEIEWEGGLERPYDLEVQARKTVAALRAAKLATHRIGEVTTIPQPRGGAWTGSDIFSALHEQLRWAAQAPLSSPAWELHLLMLSATDRSGLCGIMFDFLDDRPRQGAAIFVKEIERRYGGDAARKIVVTAVHELGHLLNLTHRFSPGVGRSDSTSFMNYDWMFRGGGQSEEFWKGFAFTFDDDELDFLKHGRRSLVIPGGAPFGSARYWESGGRALGGSRTPLVRGLQLWLTPPATGTEFAYGSPVFLQVSLRNAAGETFAFPRHLLDVKAGLLDLVIERRHRSGGAVRSVEAAAFSPALHRCFAVAATDRVPLRPGESVHDNVNLTFGSTGFSFAEPGEYRITPVLTLEGGVTGGIEGTVEGAPLDVVVRRPTTRSQRRESDIVLRSDVGMTLTLGGSDCLSGAAEALQEVVERRRRDSPGRPDGLVAAATRAQAIHAARRARKSEASRLFTAVVHPDVLATFDPHTAEHTRKLARRYGEPAVLEGGRVVVDLAARDASGVLVTRRVPGVVIPGRADGGHPAPVDVVLPGGAVPSSTTELRASAVVTASDGLTERVSADRARRCGDDSSSDDGFVLLEVSRPLVAPAKPAEPVGGPLLDVDNADAALVREALAARGIDIPASWEDHEGDVGFLDSAALADRGAPWPAPVVAEIPFPDPIGWSEVAWRWCYLFNICDDAPRSRKESTDTDVRSRDADPQHTGGDPPRAGT